MTAVRPPAPAGPEGPAEQARPTRRARRAQRAELARQVKAAKRADRANRRSAGRRSKARTVARSFSELIITFGLIVLLLVGYEVWGRVGIINAHQGDLNRRLSQAWDSPTIKSSSAAPGESAVAAPKEGSAVGRLYIPKLDLQWVVVEGTSLDDIQYAPGHYAGTAMPGGIGNFAVAGHREEGIFWDLDEVQYGDYLVVETQSNWYVYQVFQNQIVTPTSVEVIAPTPNQPGVAPTQADITLTTCNPKWDNYQRMAVHGKLVLTTPHDVQPPQLQG